jgi:aminotransferase
MTGWRIGFAIGHKDIISKLTILQENLVACAPAPAQQAAKYALSTMCDVERMVNMYEKRRNIIVDGLNNINGIKCLRPSGAFYAFANIKELGKTSYEVAEECSNTRFGIWS